MEEFEFFDDLFLEDGDESSMLETMLNPLFMPMPRDSTMELEVIATMGVATDLMDTR